MVELEFSGMTFPLAPGVSHALCPLHSYRGKLPGGDYPANHHFSCSRTGEFKRGAKHHKMSRCLTFSLVILSLLVAGLAQGSSSPCNPCEIHVISDPHTGRLAASPATRPLPSLSIVWARYYSTYEKEGWDRLEISAVPDIPVSEGIKAAAAGYAEGHLHARRVYDYWTNYRWGSKYLESWLRGAAGKVPLAAPLRFRLYGPARLPHRIPFA